MSFLVTKLRIKTSIQLSQKENKLKPLSYIKSNKKIYTSKNIKKF